MVARCNIQRLANDCRGAHPLSTLGFNIASTGGPESNFEFGRLPARSARAACLPRLRVHHVAILNKEGKGDVAYGTGHPARCGKRHAHLGGARFCPPPVGDFLKICFRTSFV